MNKCAPPLAVIAGPTASGKSALAVKLAQRANGVIVNADSAQVYADLRILSARPSEEEMGGVEHRLFGTRDGANACSAADWAADAKVVIAQVHESGQLPILVGGTGLYIRTLLDGIAEVPPVQPEIRAEVRAATTENNYERLATLNPEAAARLHPNDSQRVARALEVILSSGRPLKAWQEEPCGGIRDEVRLFGFLTIGDERRDDETIDARFEQMVELGGLDEVRVLLNRKLDPALPVMRAIGVPELAAHLEGRATLPEAIAAGQLSTRQYAKRQRTWFRNQRLGDFQHFGATRTQEDALQSLLSAAMND
jgi:tRNA dimethylallyltransferase